MSSKDRAKYEFHKVDIGNFILAAMFIKVNDTNKAA